MLEAAVLGQSQRHQTPATAVEQRLAHFFEAIEGSDVDGLELPCIPM